MATFSLNGWDKYQHYGKRESVPWVKLHRDTLTSLAWIKADDLARTVMVGSMVLAARYQNAIPLDWTLLQSVLALRCTEKQFMLALRYLAASGFIAICEQDASNALEQEEESREEKIPPKSPKGDEHEQFANFWGAYPSRGKAANPRKPAVKAFNAAVSRGAVPDDLVRLAPTAASADKHGTEFVPQATTWLNEDRWKDAPKADTAKPLDETVVWRDRVRIWTTSNSPPDRRFWPESWGPPPHKSNPKIPPAVVAEFNLDGMTPPMGCDRVGANAA
jgi:hypothetical protein